MRQALGSAALVATLLTGCNFDRFLIYGATKIDSYELPGNRIPADRLRGVALQSDGEKLGAYHATQESPGAPQLLFLKGRGGTIDDAWRQVVLFWEAGFEVFVVDYRGFGISTGTASKTGLYADARSAFEWLLAQERLGAVVLYGHSLGTAVTSQLATEVEADVVVLDAAFTSMRELVDHSAPFEIPRDWITTDEFDTLSRIDAIEEPLAIVHGEDDPRVPLWMGKRLFEAAGKPKRFRSFPGADHLGVILHHLPEVVETIAELEPEVFP